MWKGTFRPPHPSGMKEARLIATKDMDPQDIPNYQDYTEDDQQEFLGETEPPNYHLAIVYYVGGGTYYYPLTDEEAQKLIDLENKHKGERVGGRAAGTIILDGPDEEELAEELLGMTT